MELDVLIRRPPTDRGFTLVEILVAIGLLSGVLLAMAPLFMLSMKTNSSSFDRSTAAAFAKESLEKLVLLPSGDATYLRMGTGKNCYTSDPRCANGLSSSCPCTTGTTVTNVTPGTAVSGGATLPAMSSKYYYKYIPNGASAAVATPNPFSTYYTIQEFAFSPAPLGSAPSLGTPVTAGSSVNYDVKRVDIYVKSSKAGLVGLEGITMTAYIRNSYADSANPGY